MSNGDRIKFSEFQASIASFDLAEAESIIAEEFALDGKLIKDGTSGQYSKLYSVSGRTEQHPIVESHFVGSIDVLLGERLSIDWAVRGPADIEGVKYTRYLSELQAADEEQLGSIILDGAMNSVDTYYFWYSKLAMWIEDHSDAFINDMEDTIIALIEFYCVDCDPEVWHYHSADFIPWLIDASGMQASPELNDKLLKLACDHFSSWTGGPMPGEAELFAPKAKWEVVESLLDSKYSVTKEQSAISPNNLQTDNVVKGSTVTASTRYSVRLQKHIELQLTRDLDRRMRALHELPVLAGSMDAEAAQLAACSSCIYFLNASLRLTGHLEELYLKKFLFFLFTNKATCLYRVQEIVLLGSDYNSDAEKLLQSIRQHDQRRALLDSLYKLKRS